MSTWLAQSSVGLAAAYASAGLVLPRCGLWRSGWAAWTPRRKRPAGGCGCCCCPGCWPLALAGLAQPACIAMIQPLRKIHRVIFIALALLLPLLFAAALAVRRPLPANPPFPQALLKANP